MKLYRHEGDEIIPPWGRWNYSVMRTMKLYWFDSIINYLKLYRHEGDEIWLPVMRTMKLYRRREDGKPCCSFPCLASKERRTAIEKLDVSLSRRRKSMTQKGSENESVWLSIGAYHLISTVKCNWIRFDVEGLRWPFEWHHNSILRWRRLKTELRMKNDESRWT